MLRESFALKARKKFVRPRHPVFLGCGVTFTVLDPYSIEYEYLEIGNEGVPLALHGAFRGPLTSGHCG